jgi:hypothetical protein
MNDKVEPRGSSSVALLSEKDSPFEKSVGCSGSETALFEGKVAFLRVSDSRITRQHFEAREFPTENPDGPKRCEGPIGCFLDLRQRYMLDNLS